MSNNQTNRQAQATALDAAIENYAGSNTVPFSFGQFVGSYTNPLQTFRLLSIDSETESSLEASDLAKLTGLPASAFTDEVLTGVNEAELLTALGRCALVFLECVRAQIQQDILEAQSAPKKTESPADGVLLLWEEVRGSASQFGH